MLEYPDYPGDDEEDDSLFVSDQSDTGQEDDEDDDDALVRAIQAHVKAGGSLDDPSISHLVDEVLGDDGDEE